MKTIKPFTKEQKEYITMKQSFDNMFKAYEEYREKIKCCELNKRNKKQSNYKVEDVFYNLLDNHLNNKL